jgi:hypothetical protein
MKLDYKKQRVLVAIDDYLNSVWADYVDEIDGLISQIQTHIINYKNPWYTRFGIGTPYSNDVSHLPDLKKRITLDPKKEIKMMEYPRYGLVTHEAFFDGSIILILFETYSKWTKIRQKVATCDNVFITLSLDEIETLKLGEKP